MITKLMLRAKREMETNVQTDNEASAMEFPCHAINGKLATLIDDTFLMKGHQTAQLTVQLYPASWL